MQAHDPIWIFVEILENSKMPYMVTGAIASIFYGEPRLTHDIDLVLHLEKSQIESFEYLFPKQEFYCPPLEVIGIELARTPYGHFNLIHHKTGFKADVYLEGSDPLHRWGLANRKRIQLSADVSIWLAPAEYVIIRKLEFFREGGSDKHLRDIRNMLPQVSQGLNLAFLETELEARGLTQFWNKI
jgi:hypothetical protein